MLMLYKLLDCDYIEGYWNSPKWEEQKKQLLERYKKKYPNYIIKITRCKTDTKGLRCYEVWGLQ